MESPANATLLNVGTKCKADHCGLYDFLPYKCQFCSESYCSDHFRPAAHQCVKYTSTDRVAPPCPLCQTPISIKPNEDPNDAMEAHFSTSCSVMLGNDAAAKAKNGPPRCSRNRCEKVLYTPITCDLCNKQFCATHRHPDAHKCASAGPSAVLPSSAAKPREDLSDRLRAGLRLGSSSIPPSPKSGKPVGAASSTSKQAPPAKGVSAVNTKSIPTPASSASMDVGGSGNRKSPGHNPFSKVDRWVSSSSSSSAPSPSSPVLSSLSSYPSTSSASSETSPIRETTPLQAIVESNAQKPKPHLLFSSFVPPSLFGTA
jgi:predicted nucleic acid binding AN1-type Zn finger protein